MPLIAGFIFLFIQLILMVLQIIAGAIGILIAVAVLHFKAMFMLYKWAIAKLYKAAIEWRFK